LKRNSGTRKPASAEAEAFSTRYKEPASATVISLAFVRMRSSNCPTSRVSDRAIPTRLSSSSSRVAFVALSDFLRALGALFRGDFLFLSMEERQKSRRGRALRGNREYNESPQRRHTMCERWNAQRPTFTSKPKRRSTSPSSCSERASN
jgi:hypothetical protein